MKNTKNLSGLMTSMLTNKVTPEHMDDMTCSIRIKKELLKQKHYGELEMAAQEQEFAQTVLIETQLNKL